MELKKKNIHMEHLKNKILVQINLEEDYNIPERHPDALRIVQKRGNVCIEDSKSYEESVWVKGILHYEVLYGTEDKEKPLCCVAGAIMFEQHIHTDKNDKNSSPRTVVSVEKLNVRLINSRKLNVQGVLLATVFVDELQEDEVLLDIEGCSQIEMKKNELDVTTLVLSTKDIYRIKEEFALPEDRSNIGRILWKDISLEHLSYTPMDGKIQVQGNLRVFFLYDTEGDDECIQSCEMTKQILSYIDVADCEEKLDLSVCEYNRTISLETRPDYDGEERSIYIDMEIAIYIKLYKDRKYLIVQDIYGTKELLEPVKRVTNCRRILKNIGGKIRVEEFIEKPTAVAKIIHTEARILSSDYWVEAGVVRMNGTLRIEVLCETLEEGHSYICIAKELPYEYEEGLQIECENVIASGNSIVCQAEAQKVADGIEVSVVLGYQIMIQKIVCEEVVIEICRKEKETVKEMPSIAVVFAKEGECIWEIGKQYQVPVEEILQMNEMTDKLLQQGQKVLVCKETK